MNKYPFVAPVKSWRVTETAVLDEAYQDCLGQECELWSEYFDCCSFAVPAQLKAEAEQTRADREEAKSKRDRSEI